MIIEFYNEAHLGDNVYHLNFLRKLVHLTDDNFVYYVKSDYLDELNKHILGYEDSISLRSLNERRSTAINAWIGEIYYQHPNKFMYDKFYIDWFNYLTNKIYNKDMNIDMYSDYLLLSAKVPGYDILVVNSIPYSGQFEKQTELLDDVIKKLSKRYHIITTKKVDDIECTLDKELSLLDIGVLSVNSNNIIAIDTGPHSVCINKWTMQNVNSWIVAHNTNSFSFNNIRHARNLNELKEAIYEVYL